MTLVHVGLPDTPLANPRAARVHLIDIGQGAATLFEFPCAAVLVDTGGQDDEMFHSDLALLEYLDLFFQRRPDLGGKLAALYLTHPHIDHTRGAPKVFRTYQVENLVTNGMTTSSGGEEQETVQTEAKAKKVPRFTVLARDIPAGGLTNGVIDPVACPELDPKLTVLWGGIDGADIRWTESVRANANNASVVLRVDIGKSSMLITGDMEVEGLGSLVAVQKDSGALDVDVYQVGHHGSANGTTEALLQAMTPRIALIASGDHTIELDWTAWRYGHPRKVIVDMLLKHVTDRRPKKIVDVARGTRDFVQQILWKGVYSTSWDGGVVVELRDDGTEEIWIQKK
jgi:competence protein ComEC